MFQGSTHGTIQSSKGAHIHSNIQTLIFKIILERNNQNNYKSKTLHVDGDKKNTTI